MNFELILSYSLQDFLLFSSDTWWLLYSDFARRSWFLLLVLTFLLAFAMLSNKPKSNLRLYLMMSVQLLLLASCIFYYLDFYLQINEFAHYFILVCALQCLIIVWHFLYIFVSESTEQRWVIEKSSAKRKPIVEFASGRRNNSDKRDYFLVFLSMVVVAFFVKTEQSIPLLPGLSALSSVWLFLFLMRFYFRLNFISSLPALLLLVVEMMTLYSMEQQYWWLPILMFIVTMIRPFQKPIFR